MNKKDLVKQVAAFADLSHAQANRCLNAFIATVTDTLSQGDKVTLPGFQTFEARQRAGWTGRNPQTGADIEIPATTSPAFKAGQTLKKAVNA
ncbi:HU family DNA-binding protein [Billgrantia ethanolica]|uniref:HU family DNA-binding protein n=1 Tax=Billgrantia ethanolica TaxID=2733486 RepID=A0ABS9ABT2_9GAMM|nr:HU family DNA-binding protein [Halomonas ethanolica]MCE8005289.1 HU family DNA-binding protein [Halomonas ethanolica]